MRTYYQVRTGWDLPVSKKTFDCYCNMEKHVKKLLKKELTIEERMRSINVMSMPAENLAEFETVFPENKALK